MKTQDDMERQGHCPQLQNQTDVFLGHSNLPVRKTWTFTTELNRKIQATEKRCFQRLLVISYRDHVTNEEVRNTIRRSIGPYEDLINIVRKCKLRWYGHITRSTGLAKIILQGTVQEERRKGRQKKR